MNDQEIKDKADKWDKFIKDCELIQDKINYVICRVKDIDWYSNIPVFKTKFTRNKDHNDWQLVDTVKFDNLQDFQIDYLNLINLYANEVEKLLWNMYEIIGRERIKDDNATSRCSTTDTDNKTNV